MSSMLGTKQAPRAQLLDHDVAMRLAATEYDKVADLLAQLTPEQWTAQTDCTDWDVRAMAGHILGMAQMAASLPEMARQQMAAGKRVKRTGGLSIDALSALQVEKNAGLSTAELVERLRSTGRKAAKARARIPWIVRARTLPDEQVADGGSEWWTIGYLTDVILTRDPFMHRIDITRATGLSMDSAADHEGVIVDDVVRDWAERHAQPYTLELTGPAGGSWARGGEGQTLDAFDFCRILARRAPGTGLLDVEVPF